MGRLVKGETEGEVDVKPCSIAELNAYGGWSKLDLPEPLRTAPRPDAPTAGSKT
jgi:hypothetical protein